MKGPEDSLYVSDWIEIAKKDWDRIKLMLDNDDAEAAGYFLQQSIEKHIKAFLLKRGWKLRKIHELDALLDDAVKYNSDLESFRGLCERVSVYYLAQRYPPLVDVRSTCEDIEKDIEEAQNFIKILIGENR